MDSAPQSGVGRSTGEPERGGRDLRARVAAQWTRHDRWGFLAAAAAAAARADDDADAAADDGNGRDGNGCAWDGRDGNGCAWDGRDGNGHAWDGRDGNGRDGDGCAGHGYAGDGYAGVGGISDGSGIGFAASPPSSPKIGTLASAGKAPSSPNAIGGGASAYTQRKDSKAFDFVQDMLSGKK